MFNTLKLWLDKIIYDFVYCFKYDYKNIPTSHIRQKIKNQQNMSRLQIKFYMSLKLHFHVVSNEMMKFVYIGIKSRFI